MTRADPYPPEGSQQWRLLSALLNGTMVTEIVAIMDLNVMIPSARASELRRLGWPIKTVRLPHPSKQWAGAHLTGYFMEERFRRWAQNEGKGQHPSGYPGDDGRGKFGQWTLADYERDTGKGYEPYRMP